MDAPDTDVKMPLLDHLIELRKRLMWSFITLIVLTFVFYAFAEHIYQFLVSPLAQAYVELGAQSPRMIFTALHEAFFTYIKVAFFTAAFVSFPVFAIQFWAFVAPGLYKNEKKAFAPFLIATPILFLAGGAFVYYFVMPVAWRFFLGFQGGGDAGMSIELEAKVNEYLSLVMRLVFAFGICFELPVVMTLLARVGLATSQGMKEKRRYAIVAAFVAAAVLTPPDPLSQIGLAIPTILLYEVSIICARMVEKERADAETEGDGPDDDPARADADDEDDGIDEENDFNEGRKT
jgi:sec-independent protein translocase protein TatC